MQVFFATVAHLATILFLEHLVVEATVRDGAINVSEAVAHIGNHFEHGCTTSARAAQDKQHFTVSAETIDVA